MRKGVPVLLIIFLAFTINYKLAYAQRMHESHLYGIPLGIEKSELIKNMGQPDTTFITPAKKEVLGYLINSESRTVLFAEFIPEFPGKIFGLQLLGKSPLKNTPFNKTNLGDPEKAITDVYGAPDDIRNSQNSKVKVYFYKNSNYSFEFYDSKVGGISIFWTEVVEFKYMVENLITEEKTPEQEAYFKTGLYLRNNSKFATALPFFHKAIDLKTDDWEAMTALGNNYRGLKQYDKALEYYNKAQKYQPGSPVLLFNIGLAYGNNRNFPKALEYFGKITKMPSANVSKDILSSTYFNTGNMYNEVGQYDKALTNYEKALDIDNTKWLCLVYKSYIHEKFREYDKALSDINRAIFINKEDKALNESKTRLEYKNEILKNMTATEDKGDVNNDRLDEIVRKVDDTHFGIYDGEGKILYISETTGHAIGDSTRTNTIRSIVTGDLNGNSVEEIILAIDPVYTMTPTIIIYGLNPSGMMHRKLEGLSPGLGVNNKIDVRTNIYTLGTAKHIKVKKETPDVLGLSAVEYYRTRNRSFSVSIFDKSIHTDTRDQSKNGIYFINKGGYKYREKDIESIIEPSVTALAALPISGKGKKSLIFAAVEETLWIYEIENFFSSGLINKHWWKSEPFGTMITSINPTPDGNVILTTKAGPKILVKWENNVFTFNQEQNKTK